MAGFNEVKERFVRLVERWEPKFTVMAAVLFGFAALLGHIGSNRREIAKSTAELIDSVCFIAVVGVGLLQALARVRAHRNPPDYGDPKRGLPSLDTTDSQELVFKSEALVGFPKIRFFVPTEEEIEVFVEWSADDTAIAEASGLDVVKRRLLYEVWYRVDPRHFLIMQRRSTVGSLWETVAISIILALPQSTVNRLKAKKMSVVDIHLEHLQFETGERNGRYLLYDTLIFDPQFRETYSEFKRWHTIVHFAQFDAPDPDAEVIIMIEPDNPLLRRSLASSGKYGEHSTFRIVGDHVIHEFILPRTEHGPTRVAHVEFYWKLWRSKGWTVPVGGYGYLESGTRDAGFSSGRNP